MLSYGRAPPRVEPAASFDSTRVVLRGRSQLVESFVWLVPLARIDRLTALSQLNGSCASSFFVGGVICHVNSVSLCTEGEEREEEQK